MELEAAVRYTKRKASVIIFERLRADMTDFMTRV